DVSAVVGAGSEQVKGPLDGVMVGECRVGQRSGFAGIKGPKRYQEARRWNEQVGSHAAVVAAESSATGDTAGAFAIILHAHPAVLAVPAAPGAVNNHRVSGREPRGTGAKLLDPPRVLMSEGEGKFDRPLGRGPLHQVEVGVTGTCASDFHKDLPRPGLGYRHFAEFGRLLPGDKLECFHARLLSR